MINHLRWFLIVWSVVWQIISVKHKVLNWRRFDAWMEDLCKGIAFDIRRDLSKISRKNRGFFQMALECSDDLTSCGWIGNEVVQMHHNLVSIDQIDILKVGSDLPFGWCIACIKLFTQNWIFKVGKCSTSKKLICNCLHGKSNRISVTEL